MTVESVSPQGRLAAARSERIALMITGMRHSDAPGLVRIFTMLGCDSGLSASPEGYLDVAKDRVAEFNDRLLHSAGSSWSDWTAFNPDWLRTSRAQEFRNGALDLLREEFGTSSFFVLNDFRMATLLPFWREVFDSAGISCRFVHIISNPFKISERLERDDALPPSLGLLVWLRQNLAVEAGSRGAARHFVTDDDLADSWSHDVTAIARKLDFAWPRLSSNTAMEINALFLTAEPPARYRHRIAEGPLTSGWLRETHDILSAWTAKGEDAGDVAQLDAIADAFDLAAPAFAALVGTSAKSSANAAELQDGRVRLEALDQSLAVVKEEKAALVETIDALNARVLQAEGDHAATSERLHIASITEADLRQQLAGLDARATQLAAERDVLAQTAELAEQSTTGAREQLRGAQKALGSVESDLRRAEADRVSLNESVARLESALAQARADGDAKELKERVSFLESALAQKRAETDEVDGRLAEVERKFAAERACTTSQVTEIVELTKLLGEAQRRHGEDTGNQQHVAGESESALRTKFADMEAEIEMLRRHRQKIDGHLQESVAEVASVVRLLSSRDEAYRILADRTDWTSAVAAALITGTGDKSWLARLHDLLPYAWRRNRLMRRLKEQQLFDADHYLAVNPDVATAGVDPLRHYLTHGIREGRSRG